MPIPHISMVQGEKNGLFLKKTYGSVIRQPSFRRNGV